MSGYDKSFTNPFRVKKERAQPVLIVVPANRLTRFLMPILKFKIEHQTLLGMPIFKSNEVNGFKLMEFK